MVSCRASRKRLNPPHAYHDRASPFPMEEENHGTQAQKSEPLANTSFSPPAVLNYKHAVGIGLSPFEGLKHHTRLVTGGGSSIVGIGLSPFEGLKQVNAVMLSHPYVVGIGLSPFEGLKQLAEESVDVGTSGRNWPKPV